MKSNTKKCVALWQLGKGFDGAFRIQFMEADNNNSRGFVSIPRDFLKDVFASRYKKKDEYGNLLDDKSKSYRHDVFLVEKNANGGYEFVSAVKKCRISKAPENKKSETLTVEFENVKDAWEDKIEIEVPVSTYDKIKGLDTVEIEKLGENAFRLMDASLS